MGGGGYDQFFKQARKANQRQEPGVTVKFSSKAAAKPTAKSKARPKSGGGFALKQDRELDPASGYRATSEEQLRLELARRMKARKTQLLRKRQKFPAFSAITAVVALVSCSVGYYHPQSFDQLLAAVKRVDVGFFGLAAAAEDKGKSASSAAKNASAAPAVAEKTAEAGATVAENAAASKAEGKEEKALNIRDWTAEELSFFNKLNERKKELDLREAELAKLEAELQKQKEALDEKIKQLETMRSQISQTLKGRVTSDQQKVEKLVDFYSTMKPQQAAKVIETLNEDLAVEVLDRMKKKSAAEILNAMDAKKARRLSEMLTGYERMPAAESAAAPEAATTGAAASEAN